MRRHSRLPVARFDTAGDRWVNSAAAGGADRSDLTVSTYNIWFNSQHAEQRYRTIVDILGQEPPDVLVFQEVTPRARAVFLQQRWVRSDYACAAAVGSDYGNYGMLLLSRLPLDEVTYHRLPSHLGRGFLQARLQINGRPLTLCSVHLDSGKARARLRNRQLRRVFRGLRSADDAIVLGDFNMRDTESDRITAPFEDVWPALRPGDDGFTEDTSINHMRFDMKNRHRQVRFDRVLVKGQAWVPSDIHLLGTEPISPALPRVFPSDHFGVRCRLGFRAVEVATRVNHSRRWNSLRARLR